MMDAGQISSAFTLANALEIALVMLGAVATLFLGLLAWNAKEFGASLKNQGNAITDLLTITGEHQEQLKTLFNTSTRHDREIEKLEDRVYDHNGHRRGKSNI